jgi:hypothetical protein
MTPRRHFITVLVLAGAALAAPVRAEHRLPTFAGGRLSTGDSYSTLDHHSGSCRGAVRDALASLDQRLGHASADSDVSRLSADAILHVSRSERSAERTPDSWTAGLFTQAHVTGGYDSAASALTGKGQTASDALTSGSDGLQAGSPLTLHNLITPHTPSALTDQPAPPVPVVPAPGAALLASLGLGLVGLARRLFV